VTELMLGQLLHDLAIGSYEILAKVPRAILSRLLRQKLEEGMGGGAWGSVRRRSERECVVCWVDIGQGAGGVPLTLTLDSFILK
jgi:hypothetical protein